MSEVAENPYGSPVAGESRSTTASTHTYASPPRRFVGLVLYVLAGAIAICWAVATADLISGWFSERDPIGHVKHWGPWCAGFAIAFATLNGLGHRIRRRPPTAATPAPTQS